MHFGAHCDVSPFSDGKNYTGIKLASFVDDNVSMTTESK